MGTQAADEESPEVTLLVKTEECEENDENASPSPPTPREKSCSASPLTAALSKDRRNASIVYWITFVAMGLMVGSVGPLLPILYANLGHAIDHHDGKEEKLQPLPSGQLVPVFVARGFGGLAGSLLGGALLQWKPGAAHFPLGLGIVLTALGAGVMMQLSTRVWHLAAAFATLDLGCGLAQMSNTLMVWVHHDSRGATIAWLNALNGAFGLGTMAAPLVIAAAAGLGSEESRERTVCAAVAALAIIAGSAASGALLLKRPPPPPPPRLRRPKSAAAAEASNSPTCAEASAAAAAAAAAGGGMERSPSDEDLPTTLRGSFSSVASAASTAAARAKATARDNWRAAAILWLTVGGLSLAVGAETTFGAFCVAYAADMRSTGVLDISDGEAEIITSAFWAAFTAGRLGGSAAALSLPGSPQAVLAAQAAALVFGALLPVVMPWSPAALWAGAVVMGAGAAGLYAGLVAQMKEAVRVTGYVGGLIGLGPMAGIAVWQSAATAVGPGRAVAVVLVAATTLLGVQAAIHVILRTSPPADDSDDGAAESPSAEDEAAAAAAVV